MFWRRKITHKRLENNLQYYDDGVNCYFYRDFDDVVSSPQFQAAMDWADKNLDVIRSKPKPDTVDPVAT